MDITVTLNIDPKLLREQQDGLAVLQAKEKVDSKEWLVCEGVLNLLGAVADGLPDWSLEDQAAAQAQGWDIFETTRGEEADTQIVNGKPYGHRPFELQRLDEEGILPSDEAAWALVRRNATAGEPTAQRALLFLQCHSPAEYEAIIESEENR